LVELLRLCKRADGMDGRSGYSANLIDREGENEREDFFGLLEPALGICFSGSANSTVCEPPAVRPIEWPNCLGGKVGEPGLQGVPLRLERLTWREG